MKLEVASRVTTNFSIVSAPSIELKAKSLNRSSHLYMSPLLCCITIEIISYSNKSKYVCYNDTKDQYIGFL